MELFTVYGLPCRQSQSEAPFCLRYCCADFLGFFVLVFPVTFVYKGCAFRRNGHHYCVSQMDNLDLVPLQASGPYFRYHRVHNVRRQRYHVVRVDVSLYIDG